MSLLAAQDITIPALAAGFLLLAIPWFVTWRLQLGLGKDLAIAVARMTLQLTLAGLYLGYLFRWNNPVLNVTWLLVMILAAASSVLRNSALRARTFLLPAFAALTIATLTVVLYMNRVVVRLDDLLEARYLVVLGGMLLGNCLSANIVCASRFYQSLHQRLGVYEFRLGNGATLTEALNPFIKESLTAALRPGIAAMMTMGLVSLPGMMTGQMLGGSSPIVAIKYQIAIMLAIFACTTLSIGLFLVFTIRQCMDANGRLLVEKIFKLSS